MDLERLPPITHDATVVLEQEIRVDRDMSVTSQRVGEFGLGVTPADLNPWQQPGDIVSFRIDRISIPIPAEDLARFKIDEPLIVDLGLPFKPMPPAGGLEEFLPFARRQLSRYAAGKGKEFFERETKDWLKTKVGLDEFRDRGGCVPPRGRGRVFEIDKIEFRPDLKQMFIEGRFNLRLGVEVTW